MEGKRASANSKARQLELAWEGRIDWEGLPAQIRPTLRFSFLKETIYGGTAPCLESRKSFLGLPRGNFFAQLIALLLELL